MPQAPASLIFARSAQPLTGGETPRATGKSAPQIAQRQNRSRAKAMTTTPTIQASRVGASFGGRVGASALGRRLGNNHDCRIARFTLLAFVSLLTFGPWRPRRSLWALGPWNRYGFFDHYGFLHHNRRRRRSRRWSRDHCRPITCAQCQCGKCCGNHCISHGDSPMCPKK